MKKPTPNYQRHRFPSKIISHAVWLYHRFCLSFREVEELLAERGLIRAQAKRRNPNEALHTSDFACRMRGQLAEPHSERPRVRPNPYLGGCVLYGLRGEG